MARKKSQTLAATIARHSGRKKPTLPTPAWDMGADGRANQAGLVREERPVIDPDTGKKSNPNGIHGMRRVSVVGLLHRADLLTVKQVNTADQLFRAACGQLHQDSLAALGTKVDDGTSDPQAHAFDTRRDFHRLWEMVPEGSRAVIEHIVLRNQPSRKDANSRAWRDELALLRDGLDELARALDRGRKRRVA